MRNKMLKLGLVVIILISVLSILTGCGKNKELNESVNDIKVESSDKAQEKRNASDLIKLSYEYKSEDVEQNVNYLYRVPQIDESLADAKEINEEIEINILKRVKEYQRYVEQKEAPEMCQVDYKVYENNNIISVVIEEKSDFSSAINYYTVYNLNKDTGKKLSNEELLEMADVTEKELTQKLSKASGEVFDNDVKELGIDITQADWKKAYNEAKEFTTSEDNCGTDRQMYINNEGDINVITEIASLVGGDRYYAIVNINNK